MVGIRKTYTGTVTSVGITQPAAGLTFSGGPITASGSFTAALADDLAALEGMSSTGLVARTASNTYELRTITAQGSSGIAVSNGGGVSTAPSIGTTGNLFTLHNTTGSGFTYVSSGSFFGNARVMTGTSDSITVTNGSGVLGNPTFAVSSTYAGGTSIATVGTLTAGQTGAGFTVALATSTITGTLGSANGGTGNGFTKFTGPTTSEKTFTLPDSSATILTDQSTLDFPTYLRGIPGMCGFRLTLESGVALSTSNQTAKTAVYLTPCPWAPFPGIISNYESSAWVPRLSTEFSAGGSLSGLTANLPYDVFAYFNSGTPTLDLVAWSNSTTRATALATQDSVYVKSGATSRLYVGTILITGTTGQCEVSFTGSAPFIGISNHFNRAFAQAWVEDTTNSWTQGSAGWRVANPSGQGASGNRITAVFGNVGYSVNVQAEGYALSTASNRGMVGIGVDSTSVASGRRGGPAYNGSTNSYAGGYASYNANPTIGSHVYYWLEGYTSGTGNITWFGDNSSTYEQTGMEARIEY